MLQILNSQERNQAFLKFIVFFLITVALIVAAIFFDYKMPVRENAVLHDKLNSHRQVEYNQQVFIERMQEALVLLDSLDKPGIVEAQVNMQLTAKLSNLSEHQGSTNTLMGKTNKVIVEKLILLQQAKQDLRKSAQNISTYETQLRNCKETLQDARDNNRFDSQR